MHDTGKKHEARGSTLRIRVEIERDPLAALVVSDWLRSWRARGVRSAGKTSRPWPGTKMVRRFHAPEEAVADLERRLVNSRSVVLTREPVPDPDPSSS